MKPLAITLLITLSTTTALAKPKPKDSDYQDATLVSYRTVDAGAHCSTNASADDSTNTATASTNCTRRTIAEYTLLVAGQTFVLEPDLSNKAKAGAIFSLGWSTALAKNSCLYGQLPGSHVEVRSEEGVFHVKVGKRESLYRLVAADSATK